MVKGSIPRRWAGYFLPTPQANNSRKASPLKDLCHNQLIGGVVSWGILAQPGYAVGANWVSVGATPQGLAEAEFSPPDLGKMPTLQFVDASFVDAEAEFSPPDLGKMPNLQVVDAFVEIADPMAQVTSVDQLTDVKPTDWAYQAVRSLVERYGLITGYSDGTFRGNRTLSRYEFAAVLDSVLGQLNTRIAESSNLNQEDVLTLRRLQTEYGTALAELRSRLSRIGDRIDELQANQFSPTTQLQAEVLAAATEGSNSNSTVVTRQRLNLRTSFAGSDLLLTQLESGNNSRDAIALRHNAKQNLLGTAGVIADGGGLEYTEVAEGLRLRQLYYTFRPQQDVAVTVGAKMRPRDFIDRNQYANDESVDFSSSFFINNPLVVQNQIDREGGAGAAIAWNNIAGSGLKMRSLYIAADSNHPTGGLFGDRYQGSVELEYSPTPELDVKLQYTTAQINNTDINAVGINATYAFNRTTNLFGRFGIGNYQGNTTAQQLDLQPRTWAVGLALRNFVIPGTLAGVALGQPFVEGDLGNGTQTNLEAFYNFQLSDNISITPGLQVVRNANNDRDSGTTWQGTLRTSFEF